MVGDAHPVGLLHAPQLSQGLSHLLVDNIKDDAMMISEQPKYIWPSPGKRTLSKRNSAEYKSESLASPLRSKISGQIL